MPYYAVGQRDNYFMEFGQGKPIVLLHGITNSGRAWLLQVEPLVRAGYRVIIPDLAGHGASARVHEPFGVQQLATDIEALLQFLHIQHFDLMGLSLGGVVALELASRHPDQVGKLIMANSFDKMATPEFVQMAGYFTHMAPQPHCSVTLFEDSWPDMVSDAFRASATGMRIYQILHAIAASSDGCSWSWVARGIKEYDGSHLLATLPMPVLLVSGNLDQLSTLDDNIAMVHKTQKGRHVLLEGAAHISNLDSATEYTRQVLSFLQSA
ncbi:alpha/beta hydrolase [Neisseriaceae bacterium ESL0693]|nr:alpha/beta hydrolase [Neisseriaceae bacterium ESL0693]